MSLVANNLVYIRTQWRIFLYALVMENSRNVEDSEILEIRVGWIVGTCKYGAGDNPVGGVSGYRQHGTPVCGGLR